jgi:hypothetical protein
MVPGKGTPMIDARTSPKASIRPWPKQTKGPVRWTTILVPVVLAVVDGVRPKDEIEAMLAAQMAVTDIVLLELVARTRGSIAGHRYEGNGIKRLEVLSNLTNEFIRTTRRSRPATSSSRKPAGVQSSSLMMPLPG